MLSQQGGTASGRDILIPELCHVHLSSILCLSPCVTELSQRARVTVGATLGQSRPKTPQTLGSFSFLLIR